MYQGNISSGCYYNLIHAPHRTCGRQHRVKVPEENNMKRTNRDRIVKLTGIALFSAIVVVLQLLGSFIKFGPFSISLVLIPIVVGAAVYGMGAGAWLGFVFGVVVLISGDAAAFLAINPIGTVVTVLLKGVLAGLAVDLVYRLLKKINKYVAVVSSAIVCPLVNTGIFLLGCRLFFFETVTEWAGGSDVFTYMIVGLVGWNFVFELGMNILMSPGIVRLIDIGTSKFRR